MIGAIGLIKEAVGSRRRRRGRIDVRLDPVYLTPVSAMNGHSLALQGGYSYDGSAETRRCTTTVDRSPLTFTAKIGSSLKGEVVFQVQGTSVSRPRSCIKNGRARVILR